MSTNDLDHDCTPVKGESKPRMTKQAARHHLLPEHSPKSDLTGARFSKLKVLGDPRYEKTKVKWLCVCDCGAYHSVIASSLTRGITKTCGCHKRELSLAMNNKRMYASWAMMKNRCSSPNCKEYNRYGGRGIKVCKEWLKFKGFHADMFPRPKGKSLDRIDNDGDYTPENCRWATQKEQNENKSNTLRVEHKGEVKAVSRWSEELGLEREKIYTLVRYGIKPQEAFQAVLDDKVADALRGEFEGVGS